MNEDQRRPGLPAETIRALAQETGASDEQIREIVSLVGFDRASILREAHYLKKPK
ncbi:hypothetical protein NKJ46_18355 [Mesorhizobium sp. M0166]|uniref:hypothetical protein n=1 Tax=Mesorhizobium sp. M0166 TaxID=2956902 RepID=UPI00333A4E34